jgi:hypothetical protein
LFVVSLQNRVVEQENAKKTEHDPQIGKGTGFKAVQNNIKKRVEKQAVKPDFFKIKENIEHKQGKAGNAEFKPYLQ